jgi:1-deoxy-D-xylulose-5-phosphate synthase
VAEHLSEAGIATPLIRVGWPDQFIEHGSVAILREKYGMTAKAAADRILEAFRNSAAKKGASL